MNEWKKKWVGLQRTWVSKRTVCYLDIPFNFLPCRRGTRNGAEAGLEGLWHVPHITFPSGFIFSPFYMRGNLIYTFTAFWTSRIVKLHSPCTSTTTRSREGSWFTRRRQHALRVRTVTFWNILQAKTFNTSSVKSFRTRLVPSPKCSHITRLLSHVNQSARLNPLRHLYTQKWLHAFPLGLL